VNDVSASVDRWAAPTVAGLLIAGATPRLIRHLMSVFPSDVEFLDASAADRQTAGAPADLLPAVLPAGVWAVRPADIGAGHLMSVPHPPLVLFGRGDRAALTVPGVAVVGTRRMTQLGKIAAQAAVDAAVTVGAPVISGLATGVDTAAHRAALTAGLPTVAVVAGCVLAPTPAENRALVDEIVAAGGAVISENMPGTETTASLLIARNRIQVACSAVVVIAEASVKSGTTQTAVAAANTNRSLLVALPRPRHRRPQSTGLAELLASEQSSAWEPLGVSGPVKERWRAAGRLPLADGVALDRAELTELTAAAWRLHPLTADRSDTAVLKAA
jgi:DNA protecting protein DprA